VTNETVVSGEGASSEVELAPELVYFYSDGERLAGELFLPAEHPPPSGYPAIIVCHGFGGIKKFFVGDIALALTAHGFLTLTFDYRGFGDSEGRRNRLFPLEQVADVEAAVTWLGVREEVDATRIAAYGTSFGGAIVLEAAARDERLRAVVSAVGISDCERWLRDIRPYWQWLEFLHRLETDAVKRARTGESEVVEPEEIMPRDPAALANEKKLRARYPDRAFKLTLESGEAIRRFKPIESVASIAPRGVMAIGIEEDALCPWDQTVSIYKRASEPRRLLGLTGLTHHEVYEPQHIAGVLESVAAFFHECMPEA
jgi:alpha-beta hydrolase superfamily lysophospholipase